MRIGIDARFLTHPQAGGFKTYTENLITALASLDQENAYFLYLDREPTPNNLIPAQSNFQTRVITGSLPMLGVPWREQLRLPRQARRDQLDLFHSPCLTAPLFLKCPSVITVHDMIWAFPENFTSRNSWSLKRRFMDWYNYLVPINSIRRATKIITVSQAAQKDIVDTMKMKTEKIAVTHEAPGTLFRPIQDRNRLEAVRSKYGLPAAYMMALGSADPRKNLKSLIDAYALLPADIQEKYALVIVWTHQQLASETSRKIEELGLQTKVRFLQHVSNEDLVAVYGSASLFVFPSRYEGFGLPPLEAMSCGVPVVAANNSSIPEIVGEAAILFDAQDAPGMAIAIQRVLTDDALRSRLQQDGVRRAATFSWKKCAQETLAVYEEVRSRKASSVALETRQPA